ESDGLRHAALDLRDRFHLPVRRLPVRGHRPTAAPGVARQVGGDGRGQRQRPATRREARRIPMTRRLVRADLDALPSYVPGRAVPGAIKLASNEVPYGPLPGVVDAITEAATAVHRYPDMGVQALRAALADRLGVDPDRVATGCGSVALAEHLARAACKDGDEILYSWRSFEAYPIIAAATGAHSVRVPNTDEHGHD